MVTSPDSATSSVNGRSHSCQDPPFNDFSKHRSSHNDELSARLLALSESQKLIIKTVSVSEGLDSKTIGQKIHMSRITVLQQAKKLANDYKLLRYELGTKPKSAAKETFYFYLAPEITKELVQATLDSDNPIKAIYSNAAESDDFDDLWADKETHYSRNEPDGEDFDDLQARIDGLRPPLGEIFKVILEGDGITAKELSKVTGIPKPTIHARIKSLVDLNLITHETSATSSRGAYLYFPLPNLKISRTSQPEMKPNQSKQPLSEQSAKEIDVWEVIDAMARRILELENRFDKIEQSSSVRSRVQSAPIQEILRSKQS